MPDPSVRARLSLEGLSVADAYGERAIRRFDSKVWQWTDDTALAIPLVRALEAAGFVTADDLAIRYAAAWTEGPRGYGRGANALLRAICDGTPWPQAAADVFPGGSYGNGAAMRVAPLGAWFAGAPARAAAQAAVSAAPTHAHPEGVAGAVAVAVAAATIADATDGAAWLGQIAVACGASVADGLRHAAAGLAWAPEEAAARLGTGEHVTAHDTVPLALWCVAKHLHDPNAYERAVNDAVAHSVDKDTVGAIAGGVIVLRTGLVGIPTAWRDAREPLPADVAWP